MLDLHELERAYLETNDRKHEIEQSFSLARFAPDALWKLKSDQVCEFEIPEWYFDLTYPDHYRRRIKAVRLTIPCVVGPHTNVGATLRLIDSHVRTEPRLDSAMAVPPRHTTSVATSLAQSDAGVFEFSFRDERYMPFEGAGVNSRWQLTLPAKVKPFDYSTISDVILRISYTAEEDSGLRQAVEASTGVLADLATQGVTRMLSIRNDFPGAWNSLLEGNATTLAIAEVDLPFFISGFQLNPVQFDILVARQDAKPYPIVMSDTDATIVPGPDEESGLYRLARTKTEAPFVGDHPIALSGLVDPGVTDVLLRAVLKKTTT